MYGFDPPTTRLMLKGAKLGAFSLGVVAFCTGITVCVAYHLPFPPIAVTEVGVILGALSGALAGWAWRLPTGRGAVRGLGVGALLGLPAAGLWHGDVALPVWLATVGLSTLIGYQAGSAAEEGPADWKLHKG